MSRANRAEPLPSSMFFLSRGPHLSGRLTSPMVRRPRHVIHAALQSQAKPALRGLRAPPPTSRRAHHRQGPEAADSTTSVGNLLPLGRTGQNFALSVSCLPHGPSQEEASASPACPKSSIRVGGATASIANLRASKLPLKRSIDATGFLGLQTGALFPCQCHVPHRSCQPCRER